MLRDPRKSLGVKAGNLLLGGARITDVDMEKQLNLLLRDYLDRALTNVAGVAEFNRLYAKDIAKLPPEVQQQLSLYNALVREYKNLAETSKLKPASSKQAANSK